MLIGNLLVSEDNNNPRKEDDLGWRTFPSATPFPDPEPPPEGNRKSLCEYIWEGVVTNSNIFQLFIMNVLVWGA